MMSWDGATIQRFDGMVAETLELGAMTVARYTLSAGFDSAPLYRSLPGGLCPCDHWVYLVSGELRYRFADGEPLAVRAGDAARVPGGHIADVLVDSILIELTATSEHRRKAAHVAAAAEADPDGGAA
jgi:hypothetical protein